MADVQRRLLSFKSVIDVDVGHNRNNCVPTVLTRPREENQVRCSTTCRRPYEKSSHNRLASDMFHSVRTAAMPAFLANHELVCPNSLRRDPMSSIWRRVYGSLSRDRRMSGLQELHRRTLPMGVALFKRRHSRLPQAPISSRMPPLTGQFSRNSECM